MNRETKIVLFLLLTCLLLPAQVRAGYDPTIGRWLSRDPLENAEMRQGPNLYAYVGNNPVNRVDPDGLKCLLSESVFHNLTGNGSWGSIVSTLIVIGDDGQCPKCPYAPGEVLQAPLTVPFWKAIHVIISEDRLRKEQGIDVRIPYAPSA